MLQLLLLTISSFLSCISITEVYPCHFSHVRLRLLLYPLKPSACSINFICWFYIFTLCFRRVYLSISFRFACWENRIKISNSLSIFLSLSFNPLGYRLRVLDWNTQILSFFKSPDKTQVFFASIGFPGLNTSLVIQSFRNAALSWLFFRFAFSISSTSNC